MVQYAVLYPPGGAFNKLRRCQVFLGNLLKDILHDFCELPRFKEKQSFIKHRVLDQLKAKGFILMIFDGDHPERGKLVQPKECEACTKIIQKLRSMKKVLLAGPLSDKQVARKEKGLEKDVCQKLLSMKKMRLAGPPPEQATWNEERFENILQEVTSYPGFVSDQNLFRSMVPAALDAFNRIDSMPPLSFARGQNLFWPMVPAAFNAFNRVDLMLPPGFAPGRNLFQRDLADNSMLDPTSPVSSKPHPIPIIPKPPHRVENHHSTYRYRGQVQGQSPRPSHVNMPDPTSAVPPKPHHIPIMPRPSNQVQNYHSTYRHHHHRQGQRRSSQPPQIPLL